MWMGNCGLEFFGSRYWVTGSCEHGTEPAGSIMCWEYQPLAIEQGLCPYVHDEEHYVVALSELKWINIVRLREILFGGRTAVMQC